MRRLVLLMLLMAPLGNAGAEEGKRIWPWKYPAGESTQTIAGLQVTLYVPKNLQPQSQSSLLVLLHGARARAANLATFFRYWPALNYVVAAPQATGPVWSNRDLARVRSAVGVLRRALPIQRERLHVAGFSNGASNLAAVAFADDMRARSGTWVGGGFSGGAVPEWAKAQFGALFMAGENDFARERVSQSPVRLQGRVRSVELHIEPDIAHTWPTSMIEYHAWWMGVQEGRYTPGADVNFDYGDSLSKALASKALASKALASKALASEALGALKNPMQPKARGAFVYVYDEVADRKTPHGRALQHVALMDAVVRRRARRLLPVRMTRAAFAAQHPAIPIPATPAVLIFNQQGTLSQTLSGAISTAALRKALLPLTGD